MDIQKIVVGLLVLLNLFIPIFKEELFPYSAFPMFSSVHQSYEELIIVDSGEKTVDKAVVQQKYLGVPQDLTFGILPVQSMSKFGEEIKDEYLYGPSHIGNKVIINKYAQRKDGSYGLISKREVPTK